MQQADNAERDEPHQHNGAEYHRHLARPETLDREQAGQDQQGYRHHIGVERRGHDLQAFDRRQNGNGGRDDGVAEEKRRSAQADAQCDGGSLRVGHARQRHQGEGAALALVVGPQHESDIFDGNDKRQRPDDERQHAEHVRPGHGLARRMQGFAESIDGARADVAVNHAERAHHQDRHAGPAALGGRLMIDGLYLATVVGKGHGRYSR